MRLCVSFELFKVKWRNGDKWFGICDTFPSNYNKTNYTSFYVINFVAWRLNFVAWRLKFCSLTPVERLIVKSDSKIKSSRVKYSRWEIFQSDKSQLYGGTWYLWQVKQVIFQKFMRFNK